MFKAKSSDGFARYSANSTAILDDYLFMYKYRMLQKLLEVCKFVPSPNLVRYDRIFSML